MDWTKEDCQKNLYRKIFLLRKLLIDLAIQHNFEDINNESNNETWEKIKEAGKGQQDTGPRAFDGLIKLIKEKTSPLLKGATNALIKSKILQNNEEFKAKLDTGGLLSGQNIQADRYDIYLMSVLLRTNIYIQGDSTVGSTNCLYSQS